MVWVLVGVGVAGLGLVVWGLVGRRVGKEPRCGCGVGAGLS